MTSQPRQDWSGQDLAAQLGTKLHAILTQLAEWTQLGYLIRTAPGRYVLPATSDAGP